MEESHSPYHSCFSILLEAVLDYTALLQNEGKDVWYVTSPGVCLAVWKIGYICNNKIVLEGRS